MPLEGFATDRAETAAGVSEPIHSALFALVAGGSQRVIKPGETVETGTTYHAVIATRILQTIGDYRRAIRDWFEATAMDGYLVITVPHAFLYDRCATLPSPWDRRHRRLYSPSVLAREIEESLEPNSYRIRLLYDDDRGYDYAHVGAEAPEGSSDVTAIVQKIVSPSWTIAPADDAQTDAVLPDTLFFAPQTRIETARQEGCARILLLKLDHLGDFVMCLAALARVRTLFPLAHISLVVGSWNEKMAIDSGLVDHVMTFDVFPRNASEEIVDVQGKRALFEKEITGRYDLAIDLRTDHDTRFLLAGIDARTKAGVGTQSDFPFLDIFLPLDFNRNGLETSLDERLTHNDFKSAENCVRNEFRIGFDGSSRPKRGALIWGPYRNLRQGSYIFEPLIETAGGRSSATLLIDVTLGGEVVTQHVMAKAERPRLEFQVGPGGAQFESRIWADRWKAALPFSFYGGLIARKGTANVLHQSEYLLLLVELVALRTHHTGVLHNVARE